MSQTPVLVLAGGRGDRLNPLTASRPKSLLPVGPVRLIDFTLSNCRRSGLRNVCLLTQYKHEQLTRHVRMAWNGQFLCLPPLSGKHYRGPADAVFQNMTWLLGTNTRDVLILSGDHVYGMDYRNLLRKHVETNADVTVAAVRSPLVPVPKPGYPALAMVSMGIYVFRVQTLLDALHEICGRGFGYDFGHDVLPYLFRSVHVSAYDFRDEALDLPGYWHHVVNIDSYYRASMDLARPDAPVRIHDLFLGHTADAVPVAGLSGRARVCRTMLCGGVRIDHDADVQDSLLMPGVRVQSGAKLRRVIVDDSVEIPPNLSVGWDAERDRSSYTVTPGGVTVLTDFLLRNTRPAREATTAPAPFRMRQKTP